MVQIHTFTNPFLGFASDAIPHWITLEQSCLHNYWEWLSWQQETMQKNYQDTQHVMTHFMQLAANPSHLHRYIRRNWQKPYIHLNAQAITSMRLLSKFMIQNWCTWQTAIMPEQKH
ncbi:MAG: hypothetical protein JSS07_09190 [Proteobacteria bacterium]|nr:hypothetical protein [Pseudomonadota bacterium]